MLSFLSVYPILHKDICISCNQRGLALLCHSTVSTRKSLRNLLLLLQAAVDAGMRCVITYTNSSKTQGFNGAELIVGNLNAQPRSVSIKDLLQIRELYDDRDVAAL